MEVQVLMQLLSIAGAIVGAIVGGAISGYYTHKSAQIGYEKEKMKKKIVQLSNQVKSYWKLEEIYISQINASTGRAKSTIMKDARESVEKLGFVRPTMTEKEANRIIQKYEA